DVLRLVDGIGRSAEPALSCSLLRRDRLDEGVEHRRKAPTSGDVLLERRALVLRQHFDSKEARVHEIREDDVNDAVTSCERDGRLGSIERQWPHSLSLPPRENHRKNPRALVRRPQYHFPRHGADSSSLLGEFGNGLGPLERKIRTKPEGPCLGRNARPRPK